MTEVNNTDKKNEVTSGATLGKRLHRRSLLKAGAIAAPVALTLHGGVPLAHADSAGLCVINLMNIANNPADNRAAMLQVPIKGGQVAEKKNGTHKFELLPEDLANDYPPGTQLQPFDASNLNHWEFIKDPLNQRFGFSCVNSIEFNYRINGNNGWGNGDQPAPSGSLPNNNAENNPNGNPN